MKPEHICLRAGAAAIVFASLLRLSSSGLAADMTALLSKPSVASAVLYAGTGILYCASEPMPAETSCPAVSQPPAVQETEPATQVFSPEDSALVSITNYPGYELDIPAMLCQPLAWDLTVPEPTVLILHSHTCESYENTEGYTPSDPYRTRDPQYNMVSVGSYLAQCLEEKGICVIHDTTVHDFPSYNDAYTLSRKTAEQYLQQYPSIRLVLDVHRDAYEDASGNQASDTLIIDGQPTARLMLVAGTDAGGSQHTNWRQNLSLAVKLHTVLEKSYPGLCRDLTVRSYYFNQDLSTGALLIEIGTAGDTRQSALNAARLLAEGIGMLALGSN